MNRRVLAALAGLLLMVGCATQPLSSPPASPSIPPDETPEPPSAEAPAYCGAYAYCRDALLERALPDAIDGQPLTKWSLNQLALDQLTRLGVIEDTFGESYAVARYGTDPGTAGAAGPGEVAIEAIWAPGFEGDDLIDAYQQSLGAVLSSEYRMTGHGPLVLLTVGPDWYFSRQIGLVTHGETIFLIRSPFSADVGSIPPGVESAMAAILKPEPSPGPIVEPWSASTYTRDAVLERTLPDEIDGRPLEKFSLNTFALSQLSSGQLPRFSDESVFGSAYAAARFGPATPDVAVGPGKLLVEAIWVPDLQGDEIATAFAESWGAESCSTTSVVDRQIHQCAKEGEVELVAGEWPVDGSRVDFYVRGNTLYILHGDYLPVLAALTESDRPY